MALPVSPSIEGRNEGYYVAGTRISLESIAYALRRGESVTQILAEFPALPSREAVEAVIIYIRANLPEVDAYLEQGGRRWDEARKRNPSMLTKKVRMYRESLRSA